MLIQIHDTIYDSKVIADSIENGCDVTAVIECLINEIILRDTIMGEMVLVRDHNIKRNYMEESKYRCRMKRALQLV